MIKNLLITLCLIVVFCMESKSQSASDYFVHSVFEGFSLGIGYVTDSWKADIVSPEANFSSGFQVTALYGLSEKIGIYGRYQFTRNASPKPLELFFLEHANEIIHRPLEAGVSLYFGSTGDKLRYGPRLGIVRMKTEQGLFSEKSISESTLELTGYGINAGAAVYYFPASFLSVAANFDVALGKYNRLSRNGVSHKENLNFYAVKAGLSIYYHFSGR